MDEEKYHNVSQGFRPRIDYPPEMATSRPPSSLPPSGLHQHQDHIPYNSSQDYGPAHHPQSTFLPDTFQDMRTSNTISNQSSSTPSSSYHCHRYPPPDFTRPPPSVSLHEREVLGLNQGVGLRTNEATHRGHGPCQSMVTHPNYGLPSAFLNSGAASSRLSHDYPSGYDNVSNPNSYQDASMTVNFEKQDDEMWLKDFEQQILERKRNQNDCVTSPSKSKPLKLIEVQWMVSQSETLTNRLVQLKEKVNLIQDDEGQYLFELVTEIEKIKVELDGITKKFKDPLFLENVRKLIHQRRRRRLRKKKQHKLRVKERREERELWKKEEEKIDAWREKIQQEEEDKRREIAVKTEADTILGEVRQKQTDVVKMQQLIENLISLRIARLNKGAAHGYISTPQQDHVFSVTIKNIGDVVNAQMEEYKLEEQTLRVMMEESTSYRRSNAGKEHRYTVTKLESSLKKLLFGDKVPMDQKIYDEYTASEGCLKTLIQRRNEWDQFICNDDMPLATSVPSSWVVPPSHPAPDWEAFQGQK